MTEWISWEAGPAEISLEDGRTVHVDNGDLLLADIDSDDEVTFLDHDPANRTLH